jgi:hypothetical protein
VCIYDGVDEPSWGVEGICEFEFFGGSAKRLGKVANPNGPNCADKGDSFAVVLFNVDGHIVR